MASSDDDVQFISHNHPDRVICQICHQDLNHLTVHQRQEHYDEHLSDEPQASGSDVAGGILTTTKSSKGPVHTSPSKSPSRPFSRTKFSILKPALTNEQTNVFWHASQTDSPPGNFTPGLIPVLKKALNTSHEKGTTQRAWLCIEKAVYIQGEGWDRTWGCGYRNYLMACATLMDQGRQPLYFPLLDGPAPPGVRNLQILIERAWRDGYDEEGATQLNHMLVDEPKWIGTADLYVAFTYSGIPAQLVDFELSNGPGPLLQWVQNYFSCADPQTKTRTVGEALRGARAVNVTEKLPIILQHQGHSRTIVGYEQVKGGAINLLTFDPSRRLPPNIRMTGLRNHNPSHQDDRSKGTKMLHQVMHPVQTMKSHKRKSPDPHGGRAKKRRASDTTSHQEVIEISDDDEDGAPDGGRLAGGSQQQSGTDTLDAKDVLRTFRIDEKALRKYKKYQILYFPLEEPLSDAEKRKRRVVTSEKFSGK